MRRQVTEPKPRFAMEEESINTSFEPKFENGQNQNSQISDLCVHVHVEVGVGCTKTFNLLHFYDTKNKKVEQKGLELLAEILCDAAQKSSFSISDKIHLLELFSTDYKWNVLLEGCCDTVDLANCCHKYFSGHTSANFECEIECERDIHLIVRVKGFDFTPNSSLENDIKIDISTSCPVPPSYFRNKYRYSTFGEGDKTIPILLSTLTSTTSTTRSKEEGPAKIDDAGAAVLCAALDRKAIKARGSAGAIIVRDGQE